MVFLNKEKPSWHWGISPYTPCNMNGLAFSLIIAVCALFPSEARINHSWECDHEIIFSLNPGAIWVRAAIRTGGNNKIFTGKWPIWGRSGRIEYSQRKWELTELHLIYRKVNPFPHNCVCVWYTSCLIYTVQLHLSSTVLNIDLSNQGEFSH